MDFKLRVTHTPTGFTEELGPWPDSLEMRWFAQGFVRGSYAERFRDDSGHDPADVLVEVLEQSPDNDTVAQLVAEASASVTRADGTVD